MRSISRGRRPTSTSSACTLLPNARSASHLPASSLSLVLARSSHITESMNLRDVLGTDGLLKLVQTTDRLFRRSLITAQLGGVDDLDLSANCAFSERTLMGFRLHDAMSRPMDLPIGPEDDEPTNPEVHHSVPDVKIYEPGTF